MTNTYKPNNGLLYTVTYGKNKYISYLYDEDYDYLTGIKQNGIQKFKYTYNNKGNLYKTQDYINNQTVQYEYDFIDQLTKVKNSNGLDLKFDYDTKNRLSAYTGTLGGVNIKTGYIYGDPLTNTRQKPDLIYGVKLNSSQLIYYLYDVLGRRTSRTISGAMFGTSYTYTPGANANTTTTLLESVTNSGYGHPVQKISYTYDLKGNISTISENSVLKASYEYDNLSQLKRENNVYLNKTITYSYDAGGNITEKNEYAYTTGTLGTPTDTIPYVYGDANWKDKLTSYNGTPITYDAIGNPTSIGSWLLAWHNGRQLSATLKNGIGSSYKYNDEGIRTQKTAGGITTNYYLNGSRVEAESNGTDTLRYFYDENGELIGFNLTNSTYPNGSNFYYTRNGQNDIIGILSAGGTLVVSYLYDSWGKLISTSGTLANTIGEINPYRYRGYRYDTETGLFYVGSRYYDPSLCRFINADSQVSTGSDLTGMNLFAYCGNNPVMRVDPTGHAWWHWAIAAAVVVAAVAVVVVTAGGAAPAIAALAAAAGGYGGGAAAGFAVASGMALGTMAMVAASNSSSVQDFYDQGNWGTVAGTVGSGALGAVGNKGSSSKKSAPNPNGKKGGVAHQTEISKQTAKFNPAQVKYEVKINTPGGMKPYRYADFSVTENGQTWYGNFGCQLQSGLPVARERYAISDIQGAGGVIQFFPYN